MEQRLSWDAGMAQGSRPRQLLKMAFTQASTAAIKRGVRGNIPGEPFPMSKACLEAHRQKGEVQRGPAVPRGVWRILRTARSRRSQPAMEMALLVSPRLPAASSRAASHRAKA